MTNSTNKLYYDDLYLSKCQTRIVAIGPDYIETGSTVAYPEGGGQESDTGVISTNDGMLIRFISVTKLSGMRVRDPDTDFFMDAGDTIRHHIDHNDKALLESFRIGMEVIISVDVMRRALLSLSHSASHLLYVAIGSVRQGILENVIGCHIKTNGARFDFITDGRFTPDELDMVCEIANTMVDRDSQIRLYARDSSSDYRFWECDGHIIPCGGTHVSHTGIIGHMSVKRRGIGRNKERISCTFPYSQTEINKYHE